MSRLRHQYAETFKFFHKDLKFWVLGTFVAFVLIVIFSTLYLENNQDMMTSILKAFEEQTKELEIDGDISAKGLFINNSRATAISILFGFVPFLFLTSFSVVSNAAIIGAVFAMYDLAEISLLKVTVLGILPHGIFELPAIIIGDALGLYLCYMIVRRIVERKTRKGTFVYAIKNVFRTYILLIIPLLVVAALVEGFITPILLQLFM